MASNPFTRGTTPGRARPPHRGSFVRGHAKRGGRKTGTPNAISFRVRKAVGAAATRIGTKRTAEPWQRVIDTNPLIAEALERQGQVTRSGTQRLRSRPFKMKSFCQDLTALAMRAIKTGKFGDQDLVECLTLLRVRDPSEFAKFLALTAPKQSYLATRPRTEMVEPRHAVNPGEDRRPPIPEWTLRFDPTLNAYTPVPVDAVLTPEDAYHEICGAPFNPEPGWDWKFDSEKRRYRAIALKPKTPIPQWTLARDRVTPIPIDPRLRADQVYHREYGSPLYPAPGWKWQFNSRTERLVPTIADEPSRDPEARFARAHGMMVDEFPAPELRLYRWHPDGAYYTLVRDDDDDWEDDLYEYDTKRWFFKRYQPLTPTKSRH